MHKEQRELCKKLILWIMHTVLISFLPLIIYKLFYWILEFTENPIYQYISELCSFNLVVSFFITMELYREQYKNLIIKKIIGPLNYSLLFIFAALYSITFLKDRLQTDSLEKLFLMVIIISIVHFIMAIAIQILGEINEN